MSQAFDVVWDRGEIYAEFWLGNPKEIKHLEDLGLDERVTLNWVLSEYDGRAWMD